MNDPEIKWILVLYIYVQRLLKYLDGNIVMVLINTMYWSSKSYKLEPRITTIGDRQLHWFLEQLKQAEKSQKKVIIAGHMPPG